MIRGMAMANDVVEMERHTAVIFHQEPKPSSDDWKRGLDAAHTFWTANTAIDPKTGARLEYKDLKIGPDSEEWIGGA